MPPEHGFPIAPNRSWIGKLTMALQFVDVRSSSFCVCVCVCDVAVFLLSSLVTGSGLISISLLVLEFWQFSFIRDWPKTRKLEIPPSVFCPIFVHWNKLGTPNLVQMSLMKSYWILQNVMVIISTVSQLLSENQQGENKIPPPPPLTQIRVDNTDDFVDLRSKSHSA